MIERNEDWLSARVGDEILMMNAKSGKYIGVSEVGARIWELIETPMEPATLYAELRREFAVSPQVCEEEVATFLADLEKHEAVRRL